jgi:Protein of unknown function (DUF2934)
MARMNETKTTMITPKAVKVTTTTANNEQRHQQVQLAAYLRAEKHGFEGDPMQHWIAAEKEVVEHSRS